MLVKVFDLLIFFTQFTYIFCEFSFPDVKLEAFDPKGFRASIPETENVRLFAFHGNKNLPLSQIEPGEFNMDIVNPKTNGWSYFNPDLKLKFGDRIFYWVFIQHGNLGYKKSDQVWEVKELIPISRLNQTSCVHSESKVNEQVRICEKEIILESSFSENKLDEWKWQVEHFIPSEPDFEFCSYQKNDKTCFFESSNLVLNAVPFTKESEVRGTLNLTNGCTSSIQDECFMTQDAGFILPPVVSVKIKTKKQFRYGTVEVKVKLPMGDWIYPEIYLQSPSNPVKKILIAYTRGNEHLNGHGGDDIGASLLFGGPLLSDSEPERSRYLSSTKGQTFFGSEFHTYSIVWRPTKMSFFVDNILYGESDPVAASQFNEHMQLVLGIGVGGVKDFPDYYVSGNNKRKPWENYERLQVKKFFNSREDWLPSWSNGRSSMKVEYVRIWAL